MRFRVAALLFAVLFANAIPGVFDSLAAEMRSPPRGVVLLDKEAEFLVMNLSLESEWKIPTTVWHPGPADIERLEQLLPEYMRQLETPPDYQPLQEYYRQYAGAIRDGKKLIFVNSFHSSRASSWVEWLEKDPDLQKRLVERGITEDRWLYLLLGVDDGGAYYFSIRFDVETGKFGYPIFNGHA